MNYRVTSKGEKLKLVAVTKGRSIEEIQSLLRRLNIKRIAENRLVEAQEKLSNFPHLEKHFIGKLQSRKIPAITKLFDVIQSVESIKQAQIISNQGKKIKIMIQVNISGQEQRSGCPIKDFPKLKNGIFKLPNLDLIGVMGMASQDQKVARQEFKVLKKLQGDLNECSMGMSNDYQIAIEEGATFLRLGRILFEDPLPKLPNFE